ncbi:uncharacterized protein RJT21DRAFT_119370 [Scheffersomyces amazonensis]|uniref:uncharacterized protein n=1 Tax=Scheffersomyces amazonensis TaxID=1078765 RepID=UPI00315CE9FC
MADEEDINKSNNNSNNPKDQLTGITEVELNGSNGSEAIEKLDLELAVEDEPEEESTNVDSASIKSTDAILETNNDDLNTISINSAKLETPTERELNPDLDRFMTACQEGNITIVKELLSSEKVKVNDTFSDSITALHWACINNRLTIVKYLVNNNADPNFLGGDLKASPLHWACRNGLVYIVDYLISNTNADPTLTDDQSYNALHLAVHSSNITLIIYLLLTCVDTKRIYIDEPDSFNRTCLHWAAYQGDILTINALLRFGADVSKVDNSLFVPIHWAFMKGYKSVLKALVEAGSDIHAKNDQGKDCFGVAKDMNCTNTWLKVLHECDLNEKSNWTKNKHWISPKTGKVITFLIPYIILPIGFKICSFSSGFIIPKFVFSILIAFVTIYTVSKFLIPTYLIDDKALPKSPFLAGIFSGTAFWAIVIFLLNIFPKIFFKQFIFNLLLSALISLFVWSFFKAMFINPGFVPTPTDHSIILSQVKDLISIGKFDTDHFCVNTFIRKPLRSRYSRYNKKLIARFDHYCPWVYNEIGVRNHKLFMSFVYALNLSILLFTYLSCKYFDYMKDHEPGTNYDSDDEDNGVCYFLSDDLCYGYRQHHFHFNLIIWCLIQYVWIVFLCIAQTFQISKGLTTWEFSTLGNKIQSSRFNHSTVPRDLNDDSSSSVAPNGGSSNGAFDTGNNSRSEDPLRTCLNLLGLEQFLLTIKLTISSIFNRQSGTSSDLSTINQINVPTDYGLKQNWLDFWVLGDVTFRNVFYLPIEGENNLNGQVVDYYKLYEYPAKSASQIV